ncbi:transglycosylase domain-containing protein [Lactococcus termiticola]|uniref:Penicillin-binding protein 1A n=1 Tax=Lactococcus termiticola TaxID=2169526 RepID=A0A2R5HJK1_9LACT|nr:transglycosylase domain-containing protein [Lactococcus termiticola]GBG96790.1 penicillin-binding protein 1A [Lactococcus termiticola]
MATRITLTSLKVGLILVLSVILLAIAAGGAVFYYYAKDAPKLNINKLESQPSTVVYDKDNNIVATLGAEQRDTVKTNNIPVQLVNAVTSIEDHRFFNTRGIDPIRIAGAFLHNSKGGSVNGGSTLDMQLIKLSFFSTSTKDQNLRVKVQEAWMALQLDQKWTKEEIFTAYVNKVNMANGYYGMGTAAKAYYGKSLSQLSIAQTALLAGMPQAPTTYNPYTNPEAAKYRRDLVINAMFKYGKITAAQQKEAINTPITDGLQQLKNSVNIPPQDDNFLKEAIAEANQLTGEDAANAGLKIYTTLDSAAQQNLYNIVNTTDYVPFTDNIQVASTLINVQTGAVTAMIGGRGQDPNVVFGNNQAVQTDRDWGSAMKPLVDYGPAFQNGIYKSTGTYIADTGPYYYPNSSDQLNDWDNKYMGNLTVRQALTLSRNIPAIKTLAAVGLDKSNQFLTNLGFNFNDPDGGGLQYANGISSNTAGQGNNNPTYGASSLKMAAAYAAFSNGGVYTKPYYINKIVYPDGKEKVVKPERNQAMTPQTAYTITDILKGVVKGNDDAIPALSTGLTAQVPGLPEAGKTGTSNYTGDELNQALDNAGISVASLQGGSIAPDENFAGVTPQYSMAVWTGFSNRLQPIYGDNLYIATKVFKAMMTSLYPDPSSVADWTMPDGMYRSGNELTITNQ